MIEMGVPEAAAKEAVRKKAATLEIEAHSVNYDYLPSVARHLKRSYVSLKGIVCALLGVCSALFLVLDSK